ncbi:MAG: Superoxide dismutase [Candidatus Saccharibacteria bacterium]|nr:Superoxide dismutase [Candidatus Saccharibacteria bacterium]
MFTLPELGYDYDSLGDNISKEIMQLHHDKHHRTYVDKLNAALSGHDELAGKDIVELLTHLDSIPEDIRSAVRNHGGGHYNHSLFWKCMSPQGGERPGGELEAAIVEKYGDFQTFVDQFTAKALGVFGSGWVWLQPDLEIITTANQDSPLMNGQPAPLLGLDVWEHAYYLDYKNKRDDYVNAWWNVVDWNFVSQRFLGK